MKCHRFRYSSSVWNGLTTPDSARWTPNNPNLSEIQPMTAQQMAAEVLKFLLEPFRYYYYSSFAPQRVLKKNCLSCFWIRHCLQNLLLNKYQKFIHVWACKRKPDTCCTDDGGSKFSDWHDYHLSQDARVGFDGESLHTLQVSAGSMIKDPKVTQEWKQQIF